MGDSMFDLGPAVDQMSRLVAAVRDEQLDDPTPCDDWTVEGLLAHVQQFATVFTHNARKEEAQLSDGLADDWRVVIAAQLEELAAAWREESAWQGRVSAGGVEMDAADNAVVAIEELTVHRLLPARDSSVRRLLRPRPVVAGTSLTGSEGEGAAEPVALVQQEVLGDDLLRCHVRDAG